MNTKYSITLCICAITLSTYAQKNIAKFFPAVAVPTGGNANLKSLINGYITPIAEDFGQMGNSGWYTNASVHKQWGFDLNVTVNTIIIDNKSETFAPSSLSLTGITYQGGSTPLQTAYGKEGVHPAFQYTAGANTGTTFKGTDGADPGKDLPIGSLAAPAIQLGIGIFKNTDLRLRYTPTVKISDIEFGNWGVGFMHDIKQHIPSWRVLPFSLSLFAGYTKLKATTSLSGVYTGSGQEGVAKTNSYTIQLLVGKDIKFLSLYAGVGYNGSSTDFKINGTYDVTTTDSGQQLASPVKKLTNPFSDSYSKNSLRATGGMRLKFGPVTLNGDYTLLSKQSVLTAGFGFSVR